MKNKTRYLIIAVGIIACWVMVTYILYYPSSSTLGEGFTVAFLYILTRKIALVAGIIILLVRILCRNNKFFLYILLSTLNLVIGISGILLYFFDEVNLPWLNECLLNLLIGFISFTDSFVLFRSVKEQEK